MAHFLQPVGDKKNPKKSMGVGGVVKSERSLVYEAWELILAGSPKERVFSSPS